MTVKEESVIVLWGDGFCLLPLSPKIVVLPLAALVKDPLIVSVMDTEVRDSKQVLTCVIVENKANSLNGTNVMTPSPPIWEVLG